MQRAGDLVQLVEGIHESLPGFSLQHGTNGHGDTCLSSQCLEGGGEGSQIQGRPRLYRKVRTSLLAAEMVSPALHGKA